MAEDNVLLTMTPHTKAKHEILKKYLQGWFPILSSIRGRIIYLDGFAGSGRYDNNSNGSPVIALEIAKNHLIFLQLKFSESQGSCFIVKDQIVFLPRAQFLKYLLRK